MGLTLEAPRPRPSPPPPRPTEPAPAPVPAVAAQTLVPPQRRPTGVAQPKPPRVSNAPLARVVLPVRYSAWLSGDMGEAMEKRLRVSLAQFEPIQITKLPRALLVEADEAPGVFLEAMLRAAHELEDGIAATYPVFHHEMGPVWTGTLQMVFG